MTPNTVSYADSPDPIIAGLADGSTGDLGAQGDTFFSIENLIGSSSNDILAGNNNANQISGGAGDDQVRADLGNDVLNGGDGTDQMMYFFLNGGHGVTVNLATGVASGVDIGTDTLTGFESVYGSNWNDTITGNGSDNLVYGAEGNDTINGGGGNDTLIGDEGNDIINGGDGNDIIEGSLNADTLTGGAGSDTFTLSAFNFTQDDVITDFVSGEDHLEFHVGANGNVVNVGDDSWQMSGDDSPSGETFQLVGITDGELQPDDYSFV